MNAIENLSLGDNYLTPGLSQERDKEKGFKLRLHGTMMHLISQEDNEDKFSGDHRTTTKTIITGV